jgi:hypothetical protein
LGLFAVVAAALTILGANLAFATTGNTNGFPEPKVTIPSNTANAYVGRFILEGIGRGANVRSGELKIDFSESSTPQFLVGAVELYQYNANGQVETGLFALYPFRQVPGGVSAVLLSQGLETNPVGSMKFSTPKGEAQVKGQLVLNGGGPYPFVLARLAEGEQTEGNPPPSKQLAEVGQKQPTDPGWGPKPAAYAGTYELSNPQPDLSSSAGVLGPLLRTIETLGGTGAAPSSGTLKVKAPSGSQEAVAELEVEAVGKQTTYYLTDLKWLGARRVAKVHEGSATAPVVGTFEGTAQADELTGVLEGKGTKLDLSFTRAG